MAQSLQEVWSAAAANPFKPFIGKDEHFFLGFALVSLGILLCGYFGMNRSCVNVPIVGIPAGLCIGFGAVYMICAVGVYV